MFDFLVSPMSVLVPWSLMYQILAKRQKVLVLLYQVWNHLGECWKQATAECPRHNGCVLMTLRPLGCEPGFLIQELCRFKISIYILVKRKKFNFHRMSVWYLQNLPFERKMVMWEGLLFESNPCFSHAYTTNQFNHEVMHQTNS